MATNNESFDFGKVLIIGILGFGLWYFFTSGKINPGPGPDPDPNPQPIISNDFVEPPAYLKNLLPEINKKITGKKALDLAYLYRNMAGEVRFNEGITNLNQIVQKHSEIGRSVERNNKDDFKLGLGEDLNKFMLSDAVAGKVQNNLSREDKEKIATGLDAIAWGFFQSAGSEGLREFHEMFYPCDENGCPKDEQKYLEYIKKISEESSFNEPVTDENGKLLLMQSEENLQDVRGPPIDESLTRGLIIDATAITEFNKTIPKFQQFGYDGTGEGKTVLLYESVLKYDPEAFTERQSTGDCFPANGGYVRLSNHTKIPIQDIKVGDYVLNAFNEPSIVTKVFNKLYTGNIYSISTIDYKTVECTEDHLFITCNPDSSFTWKRADQLTIRDLLFCPSFYGHRSGQKTQILSIVKKPVINLTVYCIEVPNKSSFIANGIAVHNCTSHGTRNAVDIARAYEIDKFGEAEDYVVRGATEAIYGYRGHAGQGMSVDRAMKYISEVGGIALRKNYTDLGIDFSTYNPKEAIQWGRTGTPDRLNQALKNYQVENVSLVNSAEEARDAICNGFAIATGSMHSFPSKRDEYGIAKRNGRSWAHCICFGAVSTLADLTDGKVNSQEPCFLYINSWGPSWIAGPKGKYSTIPDGSFWITKDDAEFIIRQQQTYAVGQCKGYPAPKKTTFGFEWLD